MARFLTIPEMAAALNVSQTTVRRMVAGGELRTQTFRGAVRIPRAELDRLEGGQAAPTPVVTRRGRPPTGVAV